MHVCKNTDRAHGSLRPLAASRCCVNSSGVPSTFHCRQSGMDILLWPWSPPMLKAKMFLSPHLVGASNALNVFFQKINQICGCKCLVQLTVTKINNENEEKKASQTWLKCWVYTCFVLFYDRSCTTFTNFITFIRNSSYGDVLPRHDLWRCF